MRTVIFDLDGTLVDTSADLIGAANCCFRALGHGEVLDPVSDAATAFQGGRAMLRLGFDRVHPGWDEAMVDVQFPILLDAYEADIVRHSRIYPGAQEAVERLAQAGFLLGICTNKPGRLAEILLHRLNFRAPFVSLVAADTFPVRKPDPLPLREAVSRAGGCMERAMLVGDTVTDRDTARAAGVPVVLISFGPLGPGVSALEPDAVMSDFAELHDLALRLT